METAILVSAGILLAVLGGLVGVALGRYVWPAIRGCDTAALLAAQMEAARLERSTGDLLAPNVLLRRLLDAQLPQLTVRGYGVGAHFSEMANDLPEPAMLDEAADRARAIEQLIRGGVNNVVTSNAAPADRAAGSTGAPRPDRL